MIIPFSILSSTISFHITVIFTRRRQGTEFLKITRAFNSTSIFRRTSFKFQSISQTYKILISHSNHSSLTRTSIGITSLIKNKIIKENSNSHNNKNKNKNLRPP